MKTMNPLASIVLNKAANAAESTPREASSAAPTTPQATPDAASAANAASQPLDAPEEEKEEATATVGGVSVSLSKLTKLESDWKSTRGRIKQAVKDKAELLQSLVDTEANRKAKSKSAVKCAVNALDELIVTTQPRAVTKAAKQLVEAGDISEGDARVWIAYVEVASALRTAYSFGKM